MNRSMLQICAGFEYPLFQLGWIGITKPDSALHMWLCRLALANPNKITYPLHGISLYDFTKKPIKRSEF